MPWHPLPRIAFAVATYPFQPTSPADLPLEIGDELYIIEETSDGNWLRGYLVAPPNLLAGLTSVQGQTLEARVFSGIFPRTCVEVREMLGEGDEADDDDDDDEDDGIHHPADSAKSGVNGASHKRRTKGRKNVTAATADRLSNGDATSRSLLQEQEQELANGAAPRLSLPIKRDPHAPRPPAPVPMLKIGDETPTSAGEPLIDEIASCLREWHSTNLHELVLARQYPRLDKLSHMITSLNQNRQQLLHNVLTARECELVREKSVWDLVRVNKLCGGEVIVRDPKARGRVLTGDDSVIEVTKLQSVMSLLDEPPRTAAEPTALHHLLVDVRSFAGPSAAETSLVLSLVSRPSGGSAVALSEPFVISIPPGGSSIGSLAHHPHARVLFADLNAQDFGDAPSAESELFLVAKVRVAQQISHRRPLSRQGSISQGTTAQGKEPPKAAAAASSSPKPTSRRSIMWGGGKTRAVFSRGNNQNNLGAVTESPQEQQPALESRGGAASRADTKSTDALPSLQPAMATSQTAHRTIGVGVARLNAIMKLGEEAEQVINVWTPSTKFLADKPETGEDWDVLVRELLDSRTGHYEKSSGGERLQLHLHGLVHDDADELIRSTPTLLSGVCKANRIGFAGPPTKPRSDIYLSMDHASLAEGNLLSRFGGGPTAIPAGLLQGSNLQVTLEIRRPSGDRIEHCIFPSSNSHGVSAWKSGMAGRGDGWRETVRLLLSPEDVSGAHAVMLLADLPHPPFAMAYLPLWDERAFVRDGKHMLCLHRLDEFTSTAQPGIAGRGGRGGYLSLQWDAHNNKDDRSETSGGPLAALQVGSYLCSTRFSQDRVVLGLLKWKDAPKAKMPDLLKQLVFVPEIEIVKLLDDVLDSLFAVLLDVSGAEELEDLVFMALVRVLDMVHDRRFNVGPCIENYAGTKFNSPFTTPCLIRSLIRLLERPTEPETARKLRATFKVVRLVFKFIMNGRNQQMAKEAGVGITSTTQSFSKHLKAIFEALDEMMRNQAPVLVGSQTLAVQHFHTWLPELLGLLSTEDILHIAIDFMDSCHQVRGKLVLYKLVLIINYSKLDVFSHPEQRSALSANIVRWIAPHWGHVDEVTELWREQVRLCCSVLASQIDHLGPGIPDCIPKIVDSYLCILADRTGPRSRFSLLFPTSYPFPYKPLPAPMDFDEALVELSAVLSALASSPSGLQLDFAEDEMGVLLENMLSVHMSILLGEAFPPAWLSVHIHHHKSTMRALQYLANIMLDSFLPDPDEAESFNTELWKLFFATLLKLVGSPSLALETFPEQKRRAVWKIAGDVREHGAELLRRTWEAIGWETSMDEKKRYGLAKMGGYQVQYVPALVPAIVELCLSAHEGLRGMAVEVLQTMIISEWTLGEDLSVIQTEMIDCLDHFFTSKPVTESTAQKPFVDELMQRFRPLKSTTPDGSLFAALSDLVSTVDEFLDLLVAVHTGDVTGEASHLISRLRLMEFLRDMQKEDIFIRYVHQLAALQAESRNYTEAGLALGLHADLYEWNPAKQTHALAHPDLPAQSHFERKERIYFDMIKHFEDGEAWGSALAAYKKLHEQYESNVFDFAKLARTGRAIATIYETLSKSDKIVPKYYRVIYKGLGFPASLRGKEFVYEGSPNERAAAFTDRMQEQCPSAQIVTGDVDGVEGQFLVVSVLSPHRDLSHHVFQRARVPQVVRDYVVSAHPQAFAITSRRNTSSARVAEHYTDKTVFATAEAFPTILGRSEIVGAHQVRLTPHETGLERILRKTQEMGALERRAAEGDDDGLAALVEAVTSSVAPFSENSVVCYRDLLPKPRGEAEEEADGLAVEEEVPPGLEPRDNAIRMALADHAIMLKRSLAAIGGSSSHHPGIAQKHEELRGYFEITFSAEIALFSPPPPPPWPRPSPPPNPSPSPKAGAFSMANGIVLATAEETSIVQQPVAARQVHGTRLSFLGGRKKDANVPSGAAAGVDDSPRHGSRLGSLQRHASNGDAESKSLRKDNPHRRSFFRGRTSHDESRHESRRPSTNGSSKHDHAKGAESAESADWVTENGGNTTGRASTDTNGTRGWATESTQGSGLTNNNNNNTNGVAKMGSVRKRFSMLKLGKKTKGGNGEKPGATGGNPAASSNVMGSLDEE